eukprot:TRINITY_DN19434_c0_g1_i1.p1 TRINITY_DN19434_c0_g1~~TRINITY_DN19434_c0_g1_i1.p1  ORF type:complete len:321 (-),score=8.87 TRINITY_DN19434_c0_g1_i1:402-1364(-)
MACKSALFLGNYNKSPNEAAPSLEARHSGSIKRNHALALAFSKSKGTESPFLRRNRERALPLEARLDCSTRDGPLLCQNAMTQGGTRLRYSPVVSYGPCATRTRTCAISLPLNSAFLTSTSTLLYSPRTHHHGTGYKGRRQIARTSASLMAPSPASVQLAASLFTLGTAFVMPLYTLMIFAPRWPFTRKFAESPLPDIVLGFLYAFLLYLSWTPETLPAMFGSEYWLPELAGITRMFSSTLTVASAWIHLLLLDLFAARNTYLDGLRSEVETRHSVTLCLMFGPFGLVSHQVTKALSSFLQRRSKQRHREMDHYESIILE